MDGVWTSAALYAELDTAAHGLQVMELAVILVELPWSMSLLVNLILLDGFPTKIPELQALCFKVQLLGPALKLI